MGSLCSSCFGEEPAENPRNTGHTLGGGGGGGRETYQTFPADNRPGPHQPDHEEKRRQLAEAAEARRRSQEGRGVKDLEVVRRQQRRQEEVERLEKEARLRGDDGSGGLKWQMS